MQYFQDNLLYPTQKWLSGEVRRRNFSDATGEQQLNQKLEKLKEYYVQQDICTVQDWDSIPKKQRLVSYKFEDEGIMVQVQRMLNIGMPQKNQEEDLNNSDNEGENDDYKLEKFENKYLEATKQDRKRNNKEQNRMLKFLLCDGKIDVLAVELEKIYAINLDNTLPGSKLRLKGRVEIKRGTYLLRSENIEVIWNNKEGGFRTLGNVSFNNITEGLLNPKSFEKKGMLQKRKTQENKENEDQVKQESERQFKQQMDDMMMQNQRNFKGNYEYQDQDYI
ncbi:UNKNOWN [Stylonychia lemnae]|uniref:RecQ-mediated genome instability protein 1 n=1 Tax=Stylonychia lemnae TaxID=5949 RepID=A0A078B568_STYLE|nr:UNKNOWN [Stylonychia lemnae]|eukprot:CDW88392.1 UNKNOWN [Stylonychia lemnae]